MSFENLKKNRDKKLDKLVNAAKAEEKSGGQEDSRFWQPTVDTAGNGYAVIRFLPENEDFHPLPWNKYWSHGFKGPTGLWYIEKSLTSLGESDPVGELNNELWNRNKDKDCPLKKLVRERKRRLHYVSNIMVITDKEHPENEGKVFLFRYGKRIHDMIMSKMEPEFDDEEKMNPFDLWEGANFRLKIRKVDGQRNYDRSDFDSPSAISDDEEELREIYDSMHDLSEFTDRERGGYKSYDELKKHLAKVLGERVSEVSEADRDLATGDSMDPEDYPERQPSSERESESESEDIPSDVPELEDDDEAMSYFKNLAKD